MSDHGNNLDPVVKTRRVPLPPEAAFSLFTTDMGTWWPLASHSVSADALAEVVFAERTGRAITEHAPDGTTHVWAELLASEAPHRVVLAWHPGAAASPASQLSVRFEPDGAGCRLRLTQSGWERYGNDAGAELRRRYHSDWDDVLDRYIEAAAARSI
ncbi:MAG: SRPBCC domain-containing protein [Actinomycetota bacterium]